MFKMRKQSRRWKNRVSLLWIQPGAGTGRSSGAVWRNDKPGCRNADTAGRSGKPARYSIHAARRNGKPGCRSTRPAVCGPGSWSGPGPGPEWHALLCTAADAASTEPAGTERISHSAREGRSGSDTGLRHEPSCEVGFFYHSRPEIFWSRMAFGRLQAVLL